jgi:FkbM family methyltransferase
MSFRRVVRGAIPAISTVLMNAVGSKIVASVEVGASIVQGKGGSNASDLTAEVKALEPFIRTQNPVLLDVGANFGEWAKRIVAQHPGYRTLVMFEPQLVCIERLKSLSIGRSVLIEAAVAKQAGTATFHTTDQVPGWGASSLYERQDTYFKVIDKKTIQVEVTTIDQVIVDQQIDVVDFMKMDIEGAELAALQGAQQALTRGAIRAVSFEFGSGNINSRTYFRDFWDLLTPLGFKIYRMLPNGKTWPVERYDEMLEHFRGASNYVAALSAPKN